MSLHRIIDLLEADEELSGWQVREVRTRSHQSFHNKHGLEAARAVDSTSWDVEILVNHQGERGGKKQAVTGNARFSLDSLSLLEAEDALEQARFAASLVHNQPYAMTEVRPLLKRVPLADPEIEKDPQGVLRALAQAAVETAGKEDLVRMASAEFFLDWTQNRYFNSQGVQAAWESSIVSGEFVLLASQDGKESEVFRAFKRRRVADYDLAAEISLAAGLGRKSLVAKLPTTGSFDVVFSGGALDHFFSWYTTQASAAAYYNKATRAELGDALVAPGGSGTPLTLWHNATVPYGVGSYCLDASGVPAGRRLLIEKGALKARWAEDRYAQYLNMEPTGSLGNLVVDAGDTPQEELLKGSDKPVYHLFDFSYFEPNAITGEFSAEIRAGEIIDSQGRRPIKGGSVSGRSDLALKDAVFSKETVQRERYHGPAMIRCQGLTLAGEGS